MRKKALTIFASDKTVDQFNLVLGSLLCIFLISILFLKFSKPGNVNQIFSLTHSTGAELPMLDLSKKSSKYYQRILGRRKLFVAQSGLKVKKTAIADSGLANQAAGEDMQLLGIVSGAQGPQAIIMDPGTGKSFYCSGGEKINGFTVKNILENKVILEIDGVLKEIRL